MESNSESSDSEEIFLLSPPSPRTSQNVSHYRLEPAILLLFFSYNLAMTILPNQLLKMTCLSDGFDAVNCSALNDTKIEEIIQPKVAEISMISNLMHSIIPAFVSLFLGPWTDKYGRRKALVAVFIGYSLTFAGFSAISIIADIFQFVNPWIFLIPHIPLIFIGGFATLILLVYCYTTDITNESNRSSRLTLIEILIFLGFILGKIVASFLVQKIGATFVFHIATVVGILTTIFIAVFLDESIESLDKSKKGFKELFSPTPVIDMVKTCIKRRQFNERKLLWTSIVILVLSIFTYHGAYNVFYLFLREKFKWTLQDATLYQTFSSCITTIGCVVGITIFKKLIKIPDVIIVSLAMLTRVIENSIQFIASQPSTMYYSVLVGTFTTLGAPMCRSVIASVIPNNEIGKVYSFVCAFESISSVIASPLYTFIYEKTFKSLTGAFLILTTSIFVFNFVLSIYAVKLFKQRQRILNSMFSISIQQ